MGRNLIPKHYRTPTTVPTEERSQLYSKNESTTRAQHPRLPESTRDRNFTDVSARPSSFFIQIYSDLEEGWNPRLHQPKALGPGILSLGSAPPVCPITLRAFDAQVQVHPTLFVLQVEVPRRTDKPAHVLLQQHHSGLALAPTLQV